MPGGWYGFTPGMDRNGDLSDRNGGQVKVKARPWNDSSVKGFCYIDYAMEEPGWVHDGKGWWYRNPDGSYLQSQWRLINHHWYYFGADGYMLTGWQQIGGKWYYLEESGDYEGACWHERPGGSGALERWGV